MLSGRKYPWYRSCSYWAWRPSRTFSKIEGDISAIKESTTWHAGYTTGEFLLLFQKKRTHLQNLKSNLPPACYKETYFFCYRIMFIECIQSCRNRIRNKREEDETSAFCKETIFSFFFLRKYSLAESFLFISNVFRFFSFLLLLCALCKKYSSEIFSFFKERDFHRESFISNILCTVMNHFIKTIHQSSKA